MTNKTYAAIGMFQGDADWNIDVRAKGFKTYQAAKEYANEFRILLSDGQLLRDHADGRSPSDVAWHKVEDADVSLSRMKQSVRERIAGAHRAYAERGIDNRGAALDSIKAFEAVGHHDLVASEDDFDLVDLPICKWHLEPGLTCGFGSFAWAVEEDGISSIPA